MSNRLLLLPPFFLSFFYIISGAVQRAEGRPAMLVCFFVVVLFLFIIMKGDDGDGDGDDDNGDEIDERFGPVFFFY